MAARMTSPVETFGTPSAAASRSPCVPFPQPGGPSSTTITGRASETHVARPPAEAHAPLLHEGVVLPEQEVLVHLGKRIERHAHDNQQRRAAKPERDVDEVADPD